MNAITFRSVVLLIFISMHATARSDEANLCSSDEVIIASCQLKEKRNKILSFCASADNKKVNYRFGLKENIELSAGFSSSDSLSRWVDAATYTVYFGFRRGKYSYVFGVPQETLGAKAFLDVAKGDRNIMSVECMDNSFGDKMLRSDVIQDLEDELIRDSYFVFPPTQ